MYGPYKIMLVNTCQGNICIVLKHVIQFLLCFEFDITVLHCRNFQEQRFWVHQVYSAVSSLQIMFRPKWVMYYYNR